MLLLLGLLGERLPSAHPVRGHRRLLREPGRLRHEHALPERVEPGHLRLEERLLLLLRRLAKLRLLRRREAAAKRCKPGRLRLEAHLLLLLLSER